MLAAALPLVTGVISLVGSVPVSQTSRLFHARSLLNVLISLDNVAISCCYMCLPSFAPRYFHFMSVEFYGDCHKFEANLTTFSFSGYYRI